MLTSLQLPVSISIGELPAHEQAVATHTGPSHALSDALKRNSAIDGGAGDVALAHVPAFRFDSKRCRRSKPPNSRHISIFFLPADQDRSSSQNPAPGSPARSSCWAAARAETLCWWAWYWGDGIKTTLFANFSFLEELSFFLANMRSPSFYAVVSQGRQGLQRDVPFAGVGGGVPAGSP